MRRIKSNRARAAVIGALAAMAMTAGPAAAAPAQHVSGGSLSFTLLPSAAVALGQAGIGLAPLPGTTLNGITVSFPLVSGLVTPSGNGELQSAGGVVLTHDGHTVVESDYQLRVTGNHAEIYNKIGSTDTPMGSVDMGSVHMGQVHMGSVDMGSLNGATVDISPEAAQILNEELGTDAFQPGPFVTIAVDPR